MSNDSEALSRMKILLCSDGSSQADKAVLLCAAIATACTAKVSLLGIAEDAGQVKKLLEVLQRVQQLLEDQKIQAEIICKSGDPIAEIIKHAEEIQYDLIVIGAVRKGRSGSFWVSTKAYKIIKRIMPPVLIVMGEPSGLKRILICTGGRKYIESAIALAGQIARGLQAAVTLFHVMPETPPMYAEIRQRGADVEAVLSSNSELGRNLRREKESLEALGIPTEVRLGRGMVLPETFREIRRGSYDLIVAGSSLSSGPLSTYILGDVTREIVNRANRPVLVVRSGQKAKGIGKVAKDVVRGLIQVLVRKQK